jgi:hypothetical protein
VLVISRDRQIADLNPERLEESDRIDRKRETGSGPKVDRAASTTLLFRLATPQCRGARPSGPDLEHRHGGLVILSSKRRRSRSGLWICGPNMLADRVTFRSRVVRP